MLKYEANGPPTPPSMHFDVRSSGPWGNAWMPQKTWENVMEVIVKIEKTNTWGKTKTEKEKNDGE